MVDGSDVVLGGYPAKWCPRRTHNDFSPNSPEPIAVSVELQSLFDGGLRLRDGHDDTTARYEPVISFAALDDHQEAALANVFAHRLNSIITAADDAKQTLTVFHWTHPEISRTRKFPAVAAALAGRTYDLHEWFTDHYTVRGSTSLKNVAAHCGFAWAVDDPGGFASMNMIEQARTPGPDSEPARQWCLAYNQSDVAAQAAIRDTLRAALPSV